MTKPNEKPYKAPGMKEGRCDVVAAMIIIPIVILMLVAAGGA